MLECRRDLNKEGSKRIIVDYCFPADLSIDEGAQPFPRRFPWDSQRPSAQAQAGFFRESDRVLESLREVRERS
jgi:hypothetical protein